MTTSIRMNLIKEGHIILRIGADIRVEILAEGTLLLAAYQGNDTVPSLEYGIATATPVQPPVKVVPPMPVIPASWLPENQSGEPQTVWTPIPEPAPEPVVQPARKGMIQRKRGTLRLGKDSPPGHTPHNYVWNRIKHLDVPTDAEKLMYRYAEYGMAMGITCSVPPNMTNAEAFDHLKQLVKGWHTEQEVAYQKKKVRARRKATQMQLFKGKA